jgi:hypothetical protein
MDPTLSFGQFEDLTDADIRAMELIGYDTTVPEPGVAGVIVLAGFGFLAKRKRRAA